MTDGKSELQALKDAARRIGAHSVINSNSAASLLAALKELGWELRPVVEYPEDYDELVKRLLAAAAGMDEVHRAVSPGLAWAVVEMAEQAGLALVEASA